MLRHTDHRYRGLRLPALVLAAALIVAACSGDDTDADTESTAATDPAATVTETTETGAETTDTGAQPTDATEPSTPETTEATEPSTPVTASADGETWTATPPNMTPVDDATAAEWQQMTEQALAGAVGTPGVIIAVSHPELGYWSSAIGDAEVGVDPMTLEHHNRIGSITKTMTAVAILQQVDQGNMSLDDTVAEIVPEVADEFPPTAELTVNDLLTMTSGLPDYANVPGAATAQAVEDPTKVWTPEEIIAAALGASEVQPVGTPGYSTTNFTILGLMFEAVTGETIEDGVTRVASEAGLIDTALLPGDQNEMPAPSTHGYIDDAAVAALKELAGVDVVAGTDTTDWSMSWGGAGGGAYSTIDDLFLWASTGSGNTLLSTDLGAQRVVVDNYLPTERLAYGMGVMSLADGWIGHTGQAIGWEALGMYEPETGATIAVLVNSTTGMSAFYPIWSVIFGIG